MDNLSKFKNLRHAAQSAEVTWFCAQQSGEIIKVESFGDVQNILSVVGF